MIYDIPSNEDLTVSSDFQICHWAQVSRFTNTYSQFFFMSGTRDFFLRRPLNNFYLITVERSTRFIAEKAPRLYVLNHHRQLVPQGAIKILINSGNITLVYKMKCFNMKNRASKVGILISSLIFFFFCNFVLL